MTAWATTSASLWPARPRSPGNGDAAEDERTVRVVAERVDVEALPDPHRHRSSANDEVDRAS